MSKSRIVGQLGENALVLPSLVNAGLAANDRAKYFMALLQAARGHADHPDLAAADLRQERLACGIGESELDTVVGRDRKVDRTEYHIPSLQQIYASLVNEIRQMVAPLHLQSGHPGANDRRRYAAHQGTLQTPRLVRLSRQCTTKLLVKAVRTECLLGQHSCHTQVPAGRW